MDVIANIIAFITLHWMWFVGALGLIFWFSDELEVKLAPARQIIRDYFSRTKTKVKVTASSTVDDGVQAWHDLVKSTMLNGTPETLKKVLEIAEDLRVLSTKLPPSAPSDGPEVK